MVYRWTGVDGGADKTRTLSSSLSVSYSGYKSPLLPPPLQSEGPARTRNLNLSGVSYSVIRAPLSTDSAALHM